MRRVIPLVAAALLLGACGDAGMLDGVGDRVQEAVVGDQAATTTTEPDSGNGIVLRFREAAELGWWNDAIPDQTIGDPGYTTQLVWSRGKTRVIQASRAEIAAALPGMIFPRLVAEDIGWVTSQLLFDVASAQLDPGTSVQFGLWAIEPYSPEESAVVVFRVGRPNEGAIRGEIIPEVVQEGLSLIWTEGDFRYELFCATPLAEDYCWQMARSSVPLADLLATGAG